MTTERQPSALTVADVRWEVLPLARSRWRRDVAPLTHAITATASAPDGWAGVTWMLVTEVRARAFLDGDEKMRATLLRRLNWMRE